MRVIIQVGSVSAKVIDDNGDVALDYSVDNYALDADVNKLSAAIFEMLTNVRGAMEKSHD